MPSWRWFHVFIFVVIVQCRWHTLKLENDHRDFILCSSFGYSVNGSIQIIISNLRQKQLNEVGFAIFTSSIANSKFMINTKSEFCSAKQYFNYSEYTNIMVLRLNFPKVIVLNKKASSVLILPGNKYFENKGNDDGSQLHFKDQSDRTSFASMKKPISKFIASNILLTETSSDAYAEEICDVIKNNNKILQKAQKLVDSKRTYSNKLKLLLKLLIKHTLPDGKNQSRFRREAPENDFILDNSTAYGIINNKNLQHSNATTKKAPKQLINNTMSTPVIQLTLQNESIVIGKTSHSPITVGVDINTSQSPLTTTPFKTTTQKIQEIDLESKNVKISKDLYTFLEKISSMFENENEFRYTIENEQVQLNFSVTFATKEIAGAYDLYFYNCGKYPTDASIEMIEKNNENYLSVGQQPLCTLYTILSLIYFLLSIIWFLHLKCSKATVFRIHHLMLAMIVVKSISLAFHAINFYVIGRHGVREEGWAAMYYISHMARGFLFFVTILMIGAGWTFIKHVFTNRETNLFIIVIPLQILANIATIVIEESEQGASRFITWNEILIIVDLICCACVIFPVFWSIRHLQAASRTDGKATLILHKLRLFRHFYIMVICYIYFTRIISYLLHLTIPYNYVWMLELFEQTVTLIFLISVGIKFRPFTDNPYLKVPTDEDEDLIMERFEMDEVWQQSGYTDGVNRLNRPTTTKALLIERKRNERLNQLSSENVDSDSVLRDDADRNPLIRH